MTETFTYLDALFQPLALPSDGILSRTLVDNESLKLVIFQCSRPVRRSPNTPPRCPP